MYKPYPITFRSKVGIENSVRYKLDDMGVLLYKIPYTKEFDYYPVNISQYALGHYEMYYLTKKNEFKHRFLINAKWLLKNMVIKDSLGLWEHNFTLPYGYNFKIPWVHGMGQALALSALMRAYFMTEDERFIDAIHLALNVFDREIDRMGVKYVENGLVWYEEYGVIPPPHILNGFMYILISLLDIYEGLKLQRAKELASSGLETLVKKLPAYDTGYWSLYDLLHKYPATESYHNLHISQLKVLYDFTGKNTFNEFSERWREYQNNSWNKLRMKIGRGLTHIKKLGLIGSVKRYMEMKSYYKEILQ